MPSQIPDAVLPDALITAEIAARYPGTGALPAAQRATARQRVIREILTERAETKGFSDGDLLIMLFYLLERLEQLEARLP